MNKKKINKGDMVLKVCDDYNGHTLKTEKVINVKRFNEDNVLIETNKNKYSLDDVFTKGEVMKLFKED